MTQQEMENARVGVELMTAWSGADTTQFVNERLLVLAQEARQSGTDERAALVGAVGGLVSVAGLLLHWFSEQTGHSEEAILQEIARHFHAHE